MEMLEIFTYRFFQHALAASTLSAILCGVMGTYIVSRRLVFISGGITHASFGGMGLGYFLGFSPLAGAALFAAASAYLIQFLSRRNEVREDSAIGMLWSLGMAVGIIFVFLSPGYAPNLMSGLFGSILAVSSEELWLMFILTLALLGFFLFFFRMIVAIAFDSEFALTRNLPAGWINYTLMTLLAFTIVLSIKVSGIILVLAMLTIPPATANLISHRFAPMARIAVALGFAGNFAGLLLSYYWDVPSGATIIIVHIFIFAIVKILSIRRSSLPRK